MGSRKKIKPATEENTSKRYGIRIIEENLLERWPNPTPETPYEARISFPEFTCICPRSGYPDFATIHIRYRPDQYILELKSLKLYLNQFRDRPISHEESASRIYQEISGLISPSFLEVVADFNVRGNVKTVITLHSNMGKTPDTDKG
ncbi:MAG: preQ(1) synthase [Leptospirales bacterium]